MSPSPASKILDSLPTVNVAIVQTAPVFLDRERTVDKAPLKIDEGGANGANIIVFSEAGISCHPVWGEGWETIRGAGRFNAD